MTLALLLEALVKVFVLLVVLLPGVALARHGKVSSLGNGSYRKAPILGSPPSAASRASREDFDADPGYNALP